MVDRLHHGIIRRLIKTDIFLVSVLCSGPLWWPVASGICHCNQGIQNASHYLFLCPSYATPRVTLVTSVNGILHRVGLNHFQSQVYLYGDASINNSDNKKIILSTI